MREHAWRVALLEGKVEDYTQKPLIILFGRTNASEEKVVLYSVKKSQRRKSLGPRYETHRRTAINKMKLI